MKFIRSVLFFTLLFYLMLYGFNVSVDPYDKFNINLWNLKTKAVNSFRDNKFYQIDSTTEQYDMFILGSSRVQAFDPELIEKQTGMKTYNYGVNEAKPEDLLAITRHIVSRQSPKVIFLQVDFYNLNKHIPVDFRLNASPLKEYLNKNAQNEIENNMFYFYEESYTTLSAIIDSIKLIYVNKFGTVKITHKKNGMKIGNQPVEKPKLAEPYFKEIYAEYEFGDARVNYLNQLKVLCDQNSIQLIVSISPMNEEHLLKLLKDKHLSEMLLEFKRIVVDIFGDVYDFNNLSAFNYHYPYWNDSVHPSVELAKLMSKIVFSNEEHKFSDDFGVLIGEDNIDVYIDGLKEHIKNYRVSE